MLCDMIEEMRIELNYLERKINNLKTFKIPTTVAIYMILYA